jgi:hypothetical protein
VGVFSDVKPAVGTYVGWLSEVAIQLVIGKWELWGWSGTTTRVFAEVDSVLVV